MQKITKALIINGRIALQEDISLGIDPQDTGEMQEAIDFLFSRAESFRLASFTLEHNRPVNAKTRRFNLTDTPAIISKKIKYLQS